MRAAAEGVLAGKEVVVSVMTGGRDQELRKRNGEVVRVGASLKIDQFNLERDRVE